MSTVTQTQEATLTGTWHLDTVHSKVAFAVDYMAGTFHGTFAPFDATLEVGEDGSAALAGKAAVENVQVQDDNLAGHLQTPDFFDAEQAPEITFTSTSLTFDGPDVKVAGELTVRGVTRPVELTGSLGGPLVDPYGRERINLKLETAVDRTAFGIDWNAPLPTGEPALSNHVELTAELALVKE
jgi:polyisoprenoid-binding protein YceI